MDKMQESLDREAKSYEWWHAADGIKMLRQLGADLASVGQKGRLCRKAGRKPDGSATSWMYVMDGEGKQVGEAFNNSFLCPPICP